MSKELLGFAFPIELFRADMRRRRDVEVLCDLKCPILSRRVVAILDRRILRQTPRSAPSFLL